MIVSDTRKFIFLGCQKTASTSIRDILQKNGERQYRKDAHIVIVQMQQLIGMGKWNSYFKFAFVRNPWDREVSFFFFINKGDSRKYQKGEAPTLFKQFIETYTDTPCYKYVCDENLNPIIDFVGRYENLQSDFNFVCRKVGIPETPLQYFLKSTNKKHAYTHYYKNADGSYNEELVELVRRKWNKDIELFDYKFGE